MLPLTEGQKKKPKITPRCSLSPLLWQLKDCLPLPPLTGSPPEQSGMQKAGARQSRGTSPSATRKPPKPRPSWNHLSLGVLQTSCCWLRAAYTSTAPTPLGLHTPYPRDVHTDHLPCIESENGVSVKHFGRLQSSATKRYDHFEALIYMFFSAI